MQLKNPTLALQASAGYERDIGQTLTRVVGRGGAVGARASLDMQLHQTRALGSLWQLIHRARRRLHDNSSLQTLAARVFENACELCRVQLLSNVEAGHRHTVHQPALLTEPYDPVPPEFIA